MNVKLKSFYTLIYGSAAYVADVICNGGKS